MGDNVHTRKEKNPDRQLRSQSIVKWRRMWDRRNNQDVGSEAAIHLKSA